MNQSSISLFPKISTKYVYCKQKHWCQGFKSDTSKITCKNNQNTTNIQFYNPQKNLDLLCLNPKLSNPESGIIIRSHVKCFINGLLNIQILRLMANHARFCGGKPDVCSIKDLHCHFISTNANLEQECSVIYNLQAICCFVFAFSARKSQSSVQTIHFWN